MGDYMNILADLNIDRARLGLVSIKLFFKICDQWQLNDNQCMTLAGVTSRTTLHTWKKKLEQGKSLTLAPDTLERLSYVAGIYKGVQLLFSDKTLWKDWVKQPNSDFNGQSALERMLVGRVVDLADVRRYIDSWRGEYFA
jgi:hypothetical protein